MRNIEKINQILNFGVHFKPVPGDFELKFELRDNMHNVRNNFLFVFFVCSLFYIGFSLLKHEWQKVDIVNNEDMHIYCTWAMSVLTMLIYSISALICDYVQIQQFYEDIEDKIQEEKGQHKSGARDIT